MTANPQGQRPEDVGEDLPEPSQSDKGKQEDKDKDKDKDKKEAGKNDGTAHHKPGRM